MKHAAKLMPLLSPFAVAVLLILSSGSVFLAKKVIAFLILPAGLIWLGLLVIIAWPGITRPVRAMVGSLFLMYTVAGNPWFGAWLIRTLEAPYETSVEELRARSDLPLEAIFVLGGGTLRTPSSEPSLGLAGDRVIVAARLYREGLAESLVASGQSVTEVSGIPRLLSEDTTKIWIELGIDPSRIFQLPEPVNTRGEIEAYAEMIQERGWTRVGLCTSAWHLTRALEMAEEHSLDFHPVPSDFLSQKLPLHPVYAVPQTKGFRRVQTALWEYLGRIAG